MKEPKSKKLYQIKQIVFPVMTGILTIMLFFAIGCSGSTVSSREGAVKGRVLNLSGQPVSDALVTLLYDNTRWCLTDTNGEYYIEAIGFGDQAFNIAAFGFRDSQFAVHVYSEQVTEVADVTIEEKSFEYQDIKVEKTSATHAIITWKTTDYTNGIIEYGETDSLGRTFREPTGEYSTSHSLTITDLTPEKQYFFKIISSRENRAAETSVLNSFSTQSSLEDTTSPGAPTGVAAALTNVANQVTVFWAPVASLDLKGYKLYRSLSPNATFEQVNNIMIAKGQERYSDYSVTPGKKYYYRVTAIDQAGNESGYNNLASMLVPGDISTEVTWTRANSPYVIAGDMNILPTGKLNIDSGVEVKIESYDSFKRGDPDKIEINVSGAIVASAGGFLPISFSSNDTNPEKASWAGISFKNVENETNTLVNVLISDAQTAIHCDNAKGIFSDLQLTNSNVGIICDNSTDLSISRLMITRCPSGIELNTNTNIVVSDCTVIHPAKGITSQGNNGLMVSGCNFLEYTEVGLQSDEAGGVLEISNNLFVSPNALGLSLISQNPIIEYNTFDSPYCIRVAQDNPTISKNILLADKSIFGTGKKAIEYIANSNPKPKYGPNNIYGFTDETMYIGCEATTDSSKEDVLLMKEMNGKAYDYRLRQAFPDSDDTWGIQRTKIPFE